MYVARVLTVHVSYAGPHCSCQLRGSSMFISVARVVTVHVCGAGPHCSCLLCGSSLKMSVVSMKTPDQVRRHWTKVTKVVDRVSLYIFYQWPWTNFSFYRSYEIGVRLSRLIFMTRSHAVVQGRWGENYLVQPRSCGILLFRGYQHLKHQYQSEKEFIRNKYIMLVSDF